MYVLDYLPNLLFAFGNEIDNTRTITGIGPFGMIAVRVAGETHVAPTGSPVPERLAEIGKV